MKLSIQWLRRTESFVFERGVTAGEVIRQVEKRMNLPSGYSYGLLLSGNASTPLNPDLTLASSGVRDGAVLFLTVTSIRQPMAA